MPQSLQHWCELYGRYFNQSLCIDIETTRFNGPIAVIGFYRPQEGTVESAAFVRGRNLTAENLRQAFAGCKLLITYNGVSFDVPRIRKEFAGALSPTIPVLDLYRFARRLGINTNLKVLESTFRIPRLEEYQSKRYGAIRLWKRYSTFNDEEALRRLLEYNRQDVINLYPLANQLVGMAAYAPNSLRDI